MQACCPQCGTDLKEHRKQQAETIDRGIWKDPNRSNVVMADKAKKVYMATNGNTEMALIIYRKGMTRNKLEFKGAGLQPPLLGAAAGRTDTVGWPSAVIQA